MRHSQLKAFHNVALHGGFSRAAEALFLTQPAISEQVRKLEQDHDVLLFSRDRKRVRLTKEGERLFLLTRQLFEVEEQIEEYMSETRAAVEGSLRIIADSAHYITGVLARFRKKHPKVLVSLRTGNSEEVLSELRAYNAEIGIVGSIAPGQDMEKLDLGASPIVAIAAKGFFPAETRQLDLHDLAEMPLVFREKGSKTRQKLEDAAAQLKVKLIPAIEAEGREAMREVVASGAGVGFVSGAEVGRDDRIVEIPLTGVTISMNETLIYLSQRRDVRVIRAFMEHASALGAKP
ncbi:LysR substrate-binding domain-containing protein [Aliiroseovarius sp. YM-037]|uniref:LysR substrate-binding domain-containing protein n=1 Tax=Aliiroseovarius sp. YM-037 TaxID=3341728 RepID=UPI003A7FBDE1